MVRTTATEDEVQAAVKKLMTEMTRPLYFASPVGEGHAGLGASEWLISLGYAELRGAQGRSIRLTPEGWAYRERLRLGPTRYWIKHNWFPVAVAAISSLTGIGAIVVGALTLLFKD